MKTANEFFNKYGGYTREEMLQTSIEYAKEAIKADRENLLEHVKFGRVADADEYQECKNSIIDAPNIELL